MHCAIKTLSGKGLLMQTTIRITIKITADFVFQFIDPFYRHLTKPPCEFLIWQPFAANNRIHKMTFNAVTGC